MLQPGAAKNRLPAPPPVFIDAGLDFAPVGGGHRSSALQNGDALSSFLLFLAAGLAQWLWVEVERRPRGLRAGRPERPG